MAELSILHITLHNADHCLWIGEIGVRNLVEDHSFTRARQLAHAISHITKFHY